jgi:hypothetical protein
MAWPRLHAILDAAAEERRPLCFWWRDDDVGIDHPDFPRLLELAARRRVPVAVAVVPLRLTEVVQIRIAESDEATVIQHGFCHRNHAPAGAPQIELGGRDPERVMGELDWGRRILKTAFGSRFLPVLAPPWNRLDHALLPHLRCCGFVGLSTDGQRASPAPLPGLAQVNVHVDPVDWRSSRSDNRRFVGEEAALAQLSAMAACGSHQLRGVPLRLLTRNLVRHLSARVVDGSVGDGPSSRRISRRAAPVASRALVPSSGGVAGRGGTAGIEPGVERVLLIENSRARSDVFRTNALATPS